MPAALETMLAASARRLCSRRLAAAHLQLQQPARHFSASADKDLDEWKRLVDAGEKVNPCKR